MRTLFITDLDGTLLTKEAVISDNSLSILNSLIGEGINFSVATARSPWSVVNILKPLNITIPAVLMNGVCVYDLKNECFLKYYNFSDELFKELLPYLHEYMLSGFLYTIKDGKIVVFYENITTPHASNFMHERIAKFGKIFIRAYPYTSFDFGDAQPVYYTVNDKKEVLLPLYEQVKDIKGLRAEFYQDVYNKDMYFLELLSDKASKSNAALFVKEKYGFDKIVAFGDNLNDFPLFKTADYRLAVSNAHEEIKKCSDEIIKSNTEDGVALWLKENYKRFV